MALKPLEDFRSLETHHCITGSMRHIYEFHGYPISEELLLGLGAGVGFIYWHTRGTMPFYCGRVNLELPGKEGMERAAGKRTGVHIKTFRCTGRDEAEKSLIEMLSAGEPVMLQADMGFLPYLRVPEGYHFGAHAVVACGYDPSARRVLICDRDLELHPMGLEDLEQARGSRFEPWPPLHTWFTFDFSEKRPPPPEEVRNALREGVAGMLEPAAANLGVQGIRTAAELTLQWPRVLSEEALRIACMNAFIFIDAKGGSGGGNFRYMYGRFLREAADLTGDECLVEVGEEMRRIGDVWQEAAEIFKTARSAASPATLLPEAAKLVLSLADREQAAWEKLRTIAGT